MYMRGKRAKTKLYLDYQHEIRDELQGVDWPFGSELVCFKVEAGLSARQADLDNVLKPLLDTMQVIFDDFNDNKVYRIEADKVIVGKGEEYISLIIERLEDENKLSEVREQ